MVKIRFPLGRKAVKPKAKEKEPRQPPAHHQGSLPSQMDDMGHVMDAQEQREQWRRRGMCPTCGVVATHKFQFGGTVKVPLTIPNRVYKGICLSCTSMTQARLELNEPVQDFGHRGSIAEKTVANHRATRRLVSTGSGDRPSSLSGSHHSQDRPPSISGSRHYQDRTPSLSGSNHDQDRPFGLSGSHHGQDRPPGLSGSHHYQDRPPSLNGSHRGEDRPPSLSGSRYYQDRPPNLSGSHGGQVRPLRGSFDEEYLGGDGRGDQQPQERMGSQDRLHGENNVAGEQRPAGDGMAAYFGGMDQNQVPPDEDGRGNYHPSGKLRSQGRLHGENKGMGDQRPLGDARGEYFGAMEAQMGYRNQVPSVLGVDVSDDVSVMSEITLDQSIMSTHSSRVVHHDGEGLRESLAGIAEENDATNEVPSSRSTEPDHRSAFSNTSPTWSQPRSASKGSVSHHNQAGAFSGDGGRLNRLLARKLAASAASTGGNTSGSPTTRTQRNSGNGGKQLAPEAMAAAPSDAARVQLREEDRLSGEGPQAVAAWPAHRNSGSSNTYIGTIYNQQAPQAAAAAAAPLSGATRTQFREDDDLSKMGPRSVRPASILDDRIQAKLKANESYTNVRSKSEGQAVKSRDEKQDRDEKPMSFSQVEQQFDRRIQQKAMMADAPKRQMSSEDATQEFDRRLQQKAMMADGPKKRMSIEDATEEFDRRLQQKAMMADAPKRIMSSDNATDEFDRRLQKKAMMADGPKKRMSIEDATEEFDKRLQQKAMMADVSPGVQSGKDTDKYVTLLDRKMAGVSLKGNHEEDRKTTLGASQDPMSESEARSLIAGCSDCGEAMRILKRSSLSSQAVVLMALTKLRDCLLLEHGSMVSTGALGLSKAAFHDGKWTRDTMGGQELANAAFHDSEWTEVIMMVMSSHLSKAIVQADLLLTLWSIATLNPRYPSDLMSGASMAPVVTAMETHIEEERVQEFGCGLLACIATTEKHAQRLLFMCDGKFVHRLMAALYVNSRGGNVQENALKALSLLSSAPPSPKNTAATELFSSKMGRFSQDGDKVGDHPVDAIVAVRNTMGRHLTNASIQMHGNRLLWNVFNPYDIMDPDYVYIQLEQTLNHIKLAMASHLSSQVFHETVICLLSKMSCFGSKSLDSFLSAAIATMRCYPNSSTVALHGCRCVSNVFSVLLLSSLSEPEKEAVMKELAEGIPAIISCLDTFQEHISVQSEACAALSAICITCPPIKERVHQLGGIDKINRAFDLYSIDPYEGNWKTAKIRACTALTSLAVDPIVLSDIREKGIIMKFDRLLEENLEVPDDLRHVVQKLLTLATDVEKTDQNLVFREGAGEDETCGCLRANLRITKSPDFAPTRISYLRSNAIEAMQMFPDSMGIHEHACKLLACAFALASKDASTAQDEAILVKELETINTSLARHKNESRNAEAACSALQNFCVMLSLLGSSDYQSLNDQFSKSVAEVANDIVLYREDEQNLEQATGALMALCAVKEGLALNFETNSSIGLIVGAMNRFPDSFDLQKHAVGVLASFFSVSNKALDFLNEEVLTAVTRFIETEVEKDDASNLVGMAVSIILNITHKGFQGVTMLLRNGKLIDSIVSCMWKWPNCLLIQSSGIDIITNIALDNYLRAEVSQRGGTTRIISALDKLKQDQVLVVKAFAALGNLISGASVDILRSHDLPATDVLIRAMKTHPQSLPVQVGGAYALWALSAKNDTFKDEIVNLGGAEVIAEAMERFVGSKPIQERGFVVIWSLAVPKQLKVRVGRCAIRPVVNGLSAHMNSAKICEDALGCLKCLSTLPANKGMLEESGAVDLIFSCMWLHSGRPAVCRAALSALCNISVNIETNEVAELMPDDLEAIVNTMRTHQSDRALQESSIILLRNFTFSHANVKVLEQSPFLVALVRSAMSNFNSSFKNRADDLLRVLPALRQ